MGKNDFNNKNNRNKNNTKNKSNNNNVKKRTNNDFKEDKKNKPNKFLVFLGVVVCLAISVYLMNYFFVEKNYIKINMSTDRKTEYITINGEDTLIFTQKYVSDLDYSMRYDTERIKVIKYKKYDIFKFIDAEKIFVMIEKSTIPDNCISSDIEFKYNNCAVKVDDFTEEYYISQNGKTFKITVKNPTKTTNDEIYKIIIDYMLNSFVING